MSRSALDIAAAIHVGERGFKRLRCDVLKLWDIDVDGIDLAESIISTLEATSTTVVRGDFHRSWISRANLNDTVFRSCDFTGTHFGTTSIAGVTFEDCNLSYVGLAGSELSNVVFSACVMKDIRLDRTTGDHCAIIDSQANLARIGGTTWLDSDLSSLCDASGIRFGGGATVDWKSIARSAAAVNLAAFLCGTGMHELFALFNADCARALSRDFSLARRMRSTFISYGATDAEFAINLRSRLQRNGVDVYIFAVDAIPGERLSDLMFCGINRYDRIIVVCSESSLKRSGVRNEIVETFAREARDGGASYIIPVTRDDYVFQSDDEIARRLRDRVIADFRPKVTPTGYVQDDTRELIALLRALKTDPDGA